MQSLQMPGRLLVLIVALFASRATLARADSGNTSPSQPDPFGGREWELTPYLKGTATQIRESLNGEVERLSVRIKEARRLAREGKADSARDEQAALEMVRMSPGYRQIVADKAAAQTDLETARKTGSAQDRLDASSRFNKARLSLEKMEQDAVLSSPEMKRDRQEIFDAERDLKHLNEALAKASAWRDELLDATRNAFMVQGPIGPGSTGTLPRIVVEKVLDDRQVLVGFDLFTIDKSHPGKDREGMKTYPMSKRHIHVLIEGIDASAMKPDQNFSLDRNFVIQGSRADEQDGTVYLAKPSPADADRLFELIVPLRTDPDSASGSPHK